ncbi:putative sporozoite and liver stage asparagine-rich protein [Cryptosporidium felis]|nr:putative sporozoite and liver stage asparagine-rich protein [Cryptosporidium felis]
MFEHKKFTIFENETDASNSIDSFKELSVKDNQLIHEVTSNVNTPGNKPSNNGTTIIRKPYASKTPIHRQKPRHVPSFCAFTDSTTINFEKELFEKVSSDSERNIIISHYEPGTIGLRRYAVTHQDEIDGYIFDFSKRSTRLSNDTMDRTVITVGFTGRKKRWTLCPSCDCIPKADKREKIVGQWKILYLPPKGGSLMVPRCVYEAYGDVVDDCNYFAATLCPQQTYCAKHSNQTSFLNRNWHYSYRHQFALQDYIVFCDHLQSVRLVWKLQPPKDKEVNSEITAELAEKTLITVMQRFLEYAKINGTQSFLLNIPNLQVNNKNDISEDSTPLNASGVPEKDPRINSDSIQHSSSSESLISQLDLNKLQLQFTTHLNPHTQISQLMLQHNSGSSFNSLNSLSQQQAMYLQEFINYFENAKKLDSSIQVDKLKFSGNTSSSQNSPSIQTTDNLSGYSSTGATPISIDCNDTPTTLHSRMLKAAINTAEDNGNNSKTSISTIDTESQFITNNSNNASSQNLHIDLLESLRNSSLINGSIQNICGINQTFALGNLSQVQIPQIFHQNTQSNPTYLLLGPNSSIYPCYIPINHFGTYDTPGIIGGNINKQNESNVGFFPLNSQIHSELAVPYGISQNLNQPNNSNILSFTKQNIQGTFFSNEANKFIPQLSPLQARGLPQDSDKVLGQNKNISSAILKNGEN